MPTVTTYNLAGCSSCCGGGTCGCVGMPETLHAALSGCFSTNVAINRVGDSWRGTFECPGSSDNEVILRCLEGQWRIIVREAGNINGQDVEADCSPFEASATFASAGICCGGTDWTVHITE